MAHIAPIERRSAPELDEHFATIEQILGFLPNALLTMARKPGLVEAFAALVKVIYNPNDGIPLPLKSCIANVASHSAGCRYCVAHTATAAAQLGVDETKIAAVWEFETSPLFDEAERAALAFSQVAAAVPNMVTEEEFRRLRRFYDEEEIIAIMSLVSLFGYLNRWNDSMATDLEPIPKALATRALGETGWSIGKHGGNEY
jgi:uncharacterized peroxidase-related enzyme